MAMYYPVYTPVIGWDWCYDPCDTWGYGYDLSYTASDWCDTWSVDACCDDLAYGDSAVCETSPMQDYVVPSVPAPATAEPTPAAPKRAGSVLQNKPIVPPLPTDDAPKPPAVPPPPTPLESSPEPTPAPAAKEPASKVTNGRRPTGPC